MDEEKQFYTIIMRHDTSTQWAVNNPILTYGEYAVEDDTHRVKRGDGETEWNELPYEEFGLVYLVTYKNLSGEVSDNQNLQDALDKKMSIAVFDDVNHSVISSIDIVAENGAIGRLTKITKDIDTAVTSSNVILIKSADNSIQGYWSTTNEGVRILNLTAESSITDYEAGHMYYRDQLCYYKNRLYRAVEDFEAELDFNPIHWVILASKHAEDIAYDNLASELDATDVQGALDELKRRNDTKVTKTTENRVVYATTQTGAQTVIPIDDLRTVDTVNGKAATDQVSKNIQLDASDINYDDSAETPETIKEKLDQKVDKLVAGAGAKIVRDVQFNYNAETGHIELVEDKVSLEDGSSATDTTEIDVVSEQELAGKVSEINDKINQEVQTLNTTINTKETEVYNTISTKETEIYDTINTKETAIYDTINNKEDAIYDRIVAEHEEINTRVDNVVITLNNTITALDGKVDNQVSRLDGRVDNLTEVVANNKTDIEAQLANAQTALNNRIDQAVNTLNNTILHQVDIINDRIDDEVDTLDTRITTEVDTLNNTIADEVLTLNTRITTEVTNLTTYIDAQDNLKIDKDIADNIVVALDVATHDSQPTIRFTSKNTTTKNSIYDYVHFGTQGLITVRMEDADHLIIDSTAIDTINTQQNARLTNAEGRLDAHDTTIAALQEHDINHDRLLATHTSQIAGHETRLDTDEANILQLGEDLETEAITRENADNALSARVTSNAVNITTKADKEFADATADKVVGELISDTIANNELLNLKKTYVSPVDGSMSVGNIKIISSDNTVIATRQADGTIDLATNLDTDVNYFVTTDIINTTIAAETVLDMNNLTPTDKTVVEVQDIISDPEGTWGRVKSVDTVNNECTVVTFKKHAQAVWGTIKGTLSDQQDLQSALDSKIESVNGKSTTAQSKAITLTGNDIKLNSNSNTDIASILDGGVLYDVYNTTRSAGPTIGFSKRSADGSGTGYELIFRSDDINKIDVSIGAGSTSNSYIIQLQAVPDKLSYNNTISGLSSATIKTAIDELKGLIDNLKSDLQSQIRLYAQNTQYTTSGNYTVQNYVTFDRADGVTLMAKVLQNFTSDNTKSTVYESLIADVEAGNLQLVGIPEQSGNSTPTPDPTQDYIDTMNLLNSVDGGSDSYDGLGGTEAEVETILDDILGE